MSEQAQSIAQETRRVSWFIPIPIHDRLTLHSHKTGKNVQDIVSDLLDSNIPNYKIVEATDAA